MRVFVFFLLATVAYAAPQGGYNYQIQFDSSARNDLTQEQYSLLQQYAQQQISQDNQAQPVQAQQPKQPQIHILEVPDTATTSQTIKQSNEQASAGYHFASQLAQQGHQLVKFEQEQRQVNPEPAVQHVEPAAIDNVQPPPAEPQVQSEPIPQPRYEPAPQPLPEPVPQPRYQAAPQPQSEPIPQPRYQAAPQPHHHSVQFNKEFYYLSAPQEDFEQPQDIDNQLENLRKNIRVLFIRAPEQNGLANAALQLAKQSLDQQTVVYVLTKQHDSAELANKLQQVRNSAKSKPDVIFVKYKTPEEAEHAQRTIQSQYEALDGPNHFNHQGVVSTHNFVGSTDRHHANRIHLDPRKFSKSSEAEAPSSKYLPAAAKL